MTDKRFFTAVFEVKDREEFMVFAKQISGSMCGGPSMHGSEVTGCGWGDSMTEADMAREWLEDQGHDADEIMNVSNRK